jgi:hypothetical protein
MGKRFKKFFFEDNWSNYEVLSYIILLVTYNNSTMPLWLFISFWIIVLLIQGKMEGNQK